MDFVRIIVYFAGSYKVPIILFILGKGEGDGNFGEENQDLKKWEWERISSCRELYTPLVFCPPTCPLRSFCCIVYTGLDRPAASAQTQIFAPPAQRPKNVFFSIEGNE